MKRIRRDRSLRRAGRPVVRVGVPDASLTGNGGLLAVSELVERLGLVQTLDQAIGPVKQRARGLTGGQLLVGLATCQLTGGDTLSALDRLRADQVGTLLGPVVPPSTTAAGLAKRLTGQRLTSLEHGLAQVGARVIAGLPAARREVLLRQVTIDLDTTDIEVYGRLKQGVAYNYQGQKAGRVHLASWAQARIALAADLGSGTDDPRAGITGLLARAAAALPAGVGEVRARMDAGYYAGHAARYCHEQDIRFAIGAKRTPAMWRAAAAIPETAWIEAIGMPRAQVAVADHRPDWWPTGTRLLVRRVRYDTEQISADPRSRRRRTIPAGQLALALDGQADHVYGYSFILTDLPAGTPQAAAATEAWYRARAGIEDLNKESKHGAALRHLPSGDHTVNTAWMWGALLAVNLTAWLHEITGLHDRYGATRTGIIRLRRELITIPARLTGHARTLTLRTAPGYDLLPRVLARLRTHPPHPT